jgi:hypothetical protein
MKQHPFVIPSTSVPTSTGSGVASTLGPNQQVAFPVQNVSGAAGVQVFATGSAPFSVVIGESASPTGPFITTHVFQAVLQANGTYLVSQTYVPIAPYQQTTILNGTSPQTNFTISSTTLTVPTTIQATGSPGATITSRDVSVPAGTTQPLPTAPSGTRRVTVQNKGPAGTWVLVRETAAGAGLGRLLPRLGETVYGGSDGAVAGLQVQDVSLAVGGEAVATTISVQFEGS